MSLIFEEAMIGNVTLKNRLIRSATVECMIGEDGKITDEYIKLYERIARGGPGLIVPGNFFVDPKGQSHPGLFALDTDKVVPELEKLTAAVKKHGVRIFAQLNHGGRQCESELIQTRPVAPSPVREMVSLIKPRALKEGEIREIIDAYGRSAARVKQAGFDGVQINAAHGYLVSEFLSGYTNRRKDQWGGDTDNRMRFLVEIYKKIRSVVGEGFPVTVKINSEDFKKGGITPDECVSICKKLDALGIDAIEVSGGIRESGFTTTRGAIPMDRLLREKGFLKRCIMGLLEKKIRDVSAFQEAYFLHNAEHIKKNVRAPVICVGGIRKRKTMDKILADNKADFISLCRPFIIQPDLAERLRKDANFESACGNCNKCTVETVVNCRPLQCWGKN